MAHYVTDYPERRAGAARYTEALEAALRWLEENHNVPVQ